MDTPDNKNILLVDDNKVQAVLLKDWLNKETAHTFLTAFDGEDALRIMEGGGIDLVITDIQMPKMDGIALAQALHDKYPKIPIIMITGYGTVDMAVKAMRDQAVMDFIQKPCAPPLVKDAIEKALWLTRKREDDDQEKKQLTRTVNEKDLLIRETHHRVKNNINTISSLLSLQASRIIGEEAQRLLEDAGIRIRTVATIHEKLYKSENLTHINLQSYLQELMVEVASIYGRSDISIVVDARIDIDMDNVIHYGLLINEIVCNGFKYAFPKEKGGVIKISLILDGENYILTVSDNGVGLPEAVDIYNTESLGMQVVTGLAAQMDGVIEVFRKNGTTFRITLPISLAGGASEK
jgi:two-component sensor histidine kinase